MSTIHRCMALHPIRHECFCVHLPHHDGPHACMCGIQWPTSTLTAHPNPVSENESPEDQ